MLVGLHARNARQQEAEDYQTFHAAKIELAKLFGYHPLSVYQRLQSENPGIKFLVRLGPGGSPGTVDEFVARHAPQIAQLQGTAELFEIHNEPNLPIEGGGYTADRARDFNAWYLEVLNRLRSQFPWAKFGFPGLYPILSAGAPDLSDLAWIQNCQEAVNRSDWLATHCYWWDEGTMMLGEIGMRFTRFHAMFPTKTIYITEFNNPRGRLDEIAQQYSRYYPALAQYPYLAGAVSFIVSSPDPNFQTMTWWNQTTRQLYPVVGAVGNIPRPIEYRPPSPPYAIDYQSHNTPAQMQAGQTISVSLNIKNSGGKTWLAEGVNQVRLGYHWYYPDLRPLPGHLWSDLRTALPHNIAPGQTIVLQASVGAPSAPGDYILKWDMVEEMVTWFAWQGVSTLDAAISAVGGPPPGQAQLNASHNNVASGADNLLYALDNNPATRWSTRATQFPGMWFKQDLGQTQMVGGLRLDVGASPGDYPRGYIVKVSQNGVDWDTVAEKAKNDRPLDVSFTPRPARYIYIEQTGFSWIYWWSIHQLIVSAESPPENIHLSASHNSVTSGADNLLQAIDGNSATRWSSFTPMVPGMWVEADLGDLQTLVGLGLDNAASPNDYPRGYHVQLSTNRSVWTTVAEQPQNNAPLDISFPPQQARYIRVEQTGWHSQWWWSIHQFIARKG